MTLPAPPIEVPVIASTSSLAPRFLASVNGVLSDMQAWGYDPMVFETLRTDARQRFLYGFGRTYDDGRGVVTHSQSASETWHGFGLAVDIICRKDRWNAPRDFWEVLGCSSRRRGLVWGGDWNGDWNSGDERFVDRPHIQWGSGMRRSPSANASMLAAAGGLPNVWRTVGAT